MFVPIMSQTKLHLFKSIVLFESVENLLIEYFQTQKLIVKLTFHFCDPYRVNREVKHDVYGKRQTAKIEHLVSEFSRLYNLGKLFAFTVIKDVRANCLCASLLRT